MGCALLLLVKLNQLYDYDIVSGLAVGVNRLEPLLPLARRKFNNEDLLTCGVRPAVANSP
jgi:hypothetical protein